MVSFRLDLLCCRPAEFMSYWLPVNAQLPFLNSPSALTPYSPSARQELYTIPRESLDRLQHLLTLFKLIRDHYKELYRTNMSLGYLIQGLMLQLPANTWFCGVSFTVKRQKVLGLAMQIE